MPKLLVIAVMAFISCAGSLLMRHGGMNLDFSLGMLRTLREGRLWLAGIVISWVAGLLFALYVTKNEISTAFSLYVPLVYILTFLGGVLLLKESISLNKGLGCAFILIGLFFMLRAS